ncbi:hypothetical protein [Hanstruepera ponticola]|uniref:hypothetical protein n=1 Tax=Hanstruepera ponticola TaxID=2042995 RepID=UPI001781E20D|nr:hypothetical protein [Hanstruepera ponticola]
MKNILFIFLVILFSCSSSDDKIGNRIPEASSFYGLKIGNSWVYKTDRFSFSDNQYYDSGIIDSVSVIGIENIFDNDYFVIETITSGNSIGSAYGNLNGVKYEYLRESEGALLNENNEVIFDNDDFTEKIINQGNWGALYERLVEEMANVTVPAGEFVCYDRHRYGRTPDGHLMPSLDHEYYAEGIGLIYDSTSWLVEENPFVIKKLDSYSVR